MEDPGPQYSGGFLRRGQCANERSGTGKYFERKEGNPSHGCPPVSPAGVTAGFPFPIRHPGSFPPVCVRPSGGSHWSSIPSHTAVEPLTHLGFHWTCLYWVLNSGSTDLSGSLPFGKEGQPTFIFCRKDISPGTGPRLSGPWPFLGPLPKQMSAFPSATAG